MPMPLTTNVRLVLDIGSATAFAADTYLGFDFGTGTGPVEPDPTDKVALRAMIARAEQVTQVNYTLESVTPFVEALGRAMMVEMNVNATQEAVDLAYAELFAAYGALVLRPIGQPGELQVGNTYLVDIIPTESDNSGRVSTLLAPLYYPKAIVEVTEAGSIVSFFHSNTPVIASPGGNFAAPPSEVYGYAFDPTQSQTRPSQAVMRSATFEQLNADQSVRAISVDWPDFNLPLFMTIDHVPGMPEFVLPAPTFMVLNLTTAEIMVDQPFPEFDLTDDGPGVGVVDRAALRAIIAQAEAVNLANYTEITANRLTTALNTARMILNDPTAEQRQVDAAVEELQNALDGLMRRPTGQLQAGRTYLVDIRPTMAENNGVTSPLLAPLYHSQAVVEVRSGGARPSAVVTFFHSYAPVIVSPGGNFASPPTAVRGYAFDPTQSQVRPPQSVMVNALRQDLNANRTVRAISVNWPDVTRPLFVTIDHVPGMPADLLPAPTFMVLNQATATPMTQHPFPEFDLVGDGTGLPQETVDKTALRALVNRAGQVRRADYTAVSFARLTEELGNARAVLNNRNAQQRQVDAAYRDLSRALNGLVRRPTAGNVVDVNNVTDGRYTVRVDFWHATNNAPSMANGALNNRAIINVRDGNMTMSIATNPLSVTGIVTHLGTLQVHGRNASVPARNLPGNRPSQFSFPLPNRNTWHPVRFWMDPAVQVMPNAGQSLPGRLRIDWDTLQRASSDVRLSGSTAVVVAELANLEDIERTAEEAYEEAPEPVFGASIAGAAEPGTDRSELARALEANNSTMAWAAWAALGLGIIGIAAAGWWLFTRRATLAAGGKNDPKRG